MHPAEQLHFLIAIRAGLEREVLHSSQTGVSTSSGDCYNDMTNRPRKAGLVDDGMDLCLCSFWFGKRVLSPGKEIENNVLMRRNARNKRNDRFHRLSQLLIF